MTDRLRAVEIELAQIATAVQDLRRAIAMLRVQQIRQEALEKPLDPSIPIWQR